MPVRPDPDPLLCPVVVEVDSYTASLVVWPLETRSAAGRLWSEGIEELREAEATSDWSWASPVWAYVGRRRVARGVPEGVSLEFRFSRANPVYVELAAMPNLAAAAVVDRSTGAILFVRFRGRRR